MRGLRRRTLAGQLLSSSWASSSSSWSASARSRWRSPQATFNRVEGRRVSALAEQVAANPLVRVNLAVPEQRTGLATLAQRP